jgi:hypothetical protein
MHCTTPKVAARQRVQTHAMRLNHGNFRRLAFSRSSSDNARTETTARARAPITFTNLSKPAFLQEEAVRKAPPQKLGWVSRIAMMFTKGFFGRGR